MCGLRSRLRIETHRIGLRRFLFERTEVASHATRLAWAQTEITLREARERLGCTWSDVRRLIEMGMLKGRSVPWREGADTLMVDIASVAAFEKTYASTNALATLSGIPGSGLNQWLKSRGIGPVAEAEGRTLSAFWRRDEALRMVAQRRY